MIPMRRSWRPLWAIEAKALPSLNSMFHTFTFELFSSFRSLWSLAQAPRSAPRSKQKRLPTT
jgi:hypothetical protein